MRSAYVTLVCGGDAYIPGAEVLGRSLTATGTSRPMIAMVTPDVSQEGLRRLARQGFTPRLVEPIPNPRANGDLLLPRFRNVFTKLRAWELDELDKAVFLDADTLVLSNVDELFDRPALAAAPDFFLPDRFSSGVLVLEPSRDTLARMLAALPTTETYDGGDQGFLNTFFGDWWGMPAAHRLPVAYNVAHFIYQFVLHHEHLVERVLPELKIVHYILQKPWLAHPTLAGGAGLWWRTWFAGHPEEDAAWKRRLHAMEDYTFERFLEVVGA
jgi:hypothetical protein